ncbi:conditioned medium-induced protein 4 [Halobacterium zhouii]|uniref:conditioned medium-induced protein 4 n=1 Tax=Halobacterium zhouii TaxID=2902624 RepID=UPI001E405463|nr:conditioned medium-induced protein 4 [Halobacterium zhouii]
MNEKTEELRDIFVSVTDEDTVTESQEEGHGSLASEAELESRLESTVEGMREDLEFATDRGDEDLVTVVREFYAGESDADIATELEDGDAETVRHARMDLHLLRDDDTDAPVDLDSVQELDDEGANLEALAATLDVEESTAHRYRRIARTRDEIQRVNDRYRAEFENLLRDRELSERLTSEVHEDGLEEATEGQETDVEL